jgi:hypothetical protein
VRLARVTAEADFPAGEAAALTNLGISEVWLGRCRSAALHLEQALEQHRHLGDRAGEGCTLEGLGSLHIQLHQPDTAIEHLAPAYRALGEMALADQHDALACAADREPS